MNDSATASCLVELGCASSVGLRALEAMDKETRSKHDQTTSTLQTEDPLQDEARLNRLRLLLTWTTAPNGLFQLYDVKHKTHIHRVGLTGPSLLKDHIATLFPPSVEYAFISGESFWGETCIYRAACRGRCQSQAPTSYSSAASRIA